MKFTTKDLKEKFESYYKNTGEIATHIFVYSKKQEKLGQSFMEDKPTTKVNGVKYSEMRSRDAELSFNFEDTVFISVGTYNDVELL